MTYKRTTKDVWSIQVDYGWGFEEVCTEDVYADAVRTYNDYRRNVDRPVRMVKQREKL